MSNWQSRGKTKAQTILVEYLIEYHSSALIKLDRGGQQSEQPPPILFFFHFQTMRTHLCQKIYMTPPLRHWSPSKVGLMSDGNNILVMLVRNAARLLFMNRISDSILYYNLSKKQQFGPTKLTSQSNVPAEFMVNPCKNDG